MIITQRLIGDFPSAFSFFYFQEMAFIDLKFIIDEFGFRIKIDFHHIRIYFHYIILCLYYIIEREGEWFPREKNKVRDIPTWGMNKNTFSYEAERHNDAQVFTSPSAEKQHTHKKKNKNKVYSQNQKESFYDSHIFHLYMMFFF